MTTSPITCARPACGRPAPVDLDELRADGGGDPALLTVLVPPPGWLPDPDGEGIVCGACATADEHDEHADRLEHARTSWPATSTTRTCERWSATMPDRLIDESPPAAEVEAVRELQALGARWDAEREVWIVPKEKRAELLTILDRMGRPFTWPPSKN